MTSLISEGAAINSENWSSFDPVYGGKAFAGLLSDIKKGFYRAGDNILFIMTGGTPGLFAYRTAFQMEV